MPRYANVDKLMEHAISLDWSVLKWVNEVDISTAINPNVVEQKKGKWIEDLECLPITYICPFCGYTIYGDDTNFCPNCGADMREEN